MKINHHTEPMNPPKKNLSQSMSNLNTNRSAFEEAIDNIRMLNFESNTITEIINIIHNRLDEKRDIENTRDLLKLQKKFEKKLKQIETEKRRQQMIFDNLSG